MTNIKVFNLNLSGNYPFEKYSMIPVTFNLGNLPLDFTSIFWNQLDGSGVAIPTGGSLITRNFLNYYRNPLVQVLDATDGYYNNFVIYENIDYNKYSNKFIVSNTGNLETRYIERVSTAKLSNTTTNPSTITIDSSAIRQNYKTPYEFYFFYIQLNDNTKNSYGYILYPNKICLKPLQVTNLNDKWQLTTTVNLISSDIVHIQSYDIEAEAIKYHNNRRNFLPPNILTLPNTLSSYKINFDLYSNKTYIGTNVISVIADNTEASSLTAAIPLFDDVVSIDPDSVFITYNGYSLTNNLSVVQFSKNDSLFYLNQRFNPSFVLNYNPLLESTLNFKLVQLELDTSRLLRETQNSVLSASLNVTNGYFNYYNDPLRIVNFNKNYPLQIDAIVNGNNLINAGVSVASTITNGQFKINGVDRFIGDAIEVTSLSANEQVVFETTYPPYCYNYKITLKNPLNANQYLDSNGLNFYLKLSAFDQNASSTSMSAFMISDFGEIKIPISENDQIKFKIVSTSIENDIDFIKNVAAYYNTPQEGAVPYDIFTSPYVPVKSNAFLNLNYSDATFRGIQFAVKATIKTFSGEIDSFENQNISLDEPIVDTGTNLFLNVIDEKSNEISIDASLNITETEWPGRDLTATGVYSATKIKWFYGNTPNLSLNYIDNEGNFIRPVTGEDTFSDQTWRVKLSGYGPFIATVSLSSSKYNQVATLSTNPNLFDFLGNGKIKVGAYQPLNNLNVTRSIVLTAAFPYGDKLFNIPSNIPINWTWQYDDTTDPDLQPIFVTTNNNQQYYYGTDVNPTSISSVKFNIIPPYSNFPNIHNVKVMANINSVQPPINGEYVIRVDDFPSSEIFNSDFETYYKNYNSDLNFAIAKTRDNTNIITRSNQSVLDFTFKANLDQISKTLNGTLYWIYNNNRLSENFIEYNIELTNPVSGLKTEKINNLTLSTLKIGLTLDSAIAPGWTSAHNVSAYTYFYILPIEEFYKPLEFIIYPEYAWVGERIIGTDTYDFTKLTYLTSTPPISIEDQYLYSYYTNSFAPTAYVNKKSKSQTFWVSANKNYFTEYLYQSLQNFTVNSPLCSYSLIDLKYDPLKSTTYTGIPIFLIAYNNVFYPETMKQTYIDELPSNTIFVPENLRLATSEEKGTYLVTQSHQITARTTDKIKYEFDENYIKNFSYSPKFIFYNDLLFQFIPFVNDQPVNSFNLQFSAAKISVGHLISTIPNYQPALVVGGSVTYYLSSLYWTISTVIPTFVTNQSSYHDLFLINYGDPSIPYFAGELGLTEFYIYAKPNFIQQIPPSTFDKYNMKQDLWEGVLAVE
jgi:hypothetical protein